ncbi:YeiH family protein [Virgibacillus litoralis]|uniref:Integral membrane protein (TIGR00698 family) n=1 Tax=Virgibacillus litoralis TaxID=578221 RepID=A0ABS4HHI4_9BACI|nr:putative sulfate exporter family transporter [Virgibacillus litoralis]MBP1949877.1 putative integral membrane protein (TIGR00698 family) [Virgibacillus litoralis]
MSIENQKIQADPQETEPQEDPSSKQRLKWIAGVAFTFFIALLGFLLALIPGFAYVGQLACAIIIAIIYRQIFGYPEALRAGVTFSSKKLLRLAIILYGLRLNINVVLSDGLGLLLRDAFIILFAIIAMIWLAKVFKANSTISLLLGVGTGVCGAAAIAAVAPIIKAKDEDTAIGVGIIALMGTVFSIAYTIVRPILPISAVDYGTWSGLSLHELAHVALAAAPAGQDALAIALLAKLGRVFLLIPLCFILIYIMKTKRKGSEHASTKIAFPWFLIGFMALSILGTYVFGHSIPVSDEVFNSVYTLTTWLLTAAMVGLGLSVSLKDLRTKAMKPLIAMTITSAVLSVIAFLIV